MAAPTLAPSVPAPLWVRRLTSPWAAAVVLALFWLLLVGSVQRKSITYDESLHAASGYVYWKHGDYRMQPENGNLPQRWAALGFLGMETKGPDTQSQDWMLADQWRVADQWFHRLGNDTLSLLARGRAMSAAWAVALAGLVWAWSRRLFGPAGGMLSLLLCALNPTLLANGPLITSDACAALFFLAATGAWWALLHRLTVPRLLASCLVAGGLFVAKMSAVLIIPIAGILAVARLVRREPLSLGSRLLTRRRDQAAAIAVAGLLHVAVVFAVIWGSYGFRFSMFAPGLPGPNPGTEMWREMLGRRSLPEALKEIGLNPDASGPIRQILDQHSVPGFGWTDVSDTALAELKDKALTPVQANQLAAVVASDRPTGTAAVIQALRDRAVLPEAYLYGYLHTWRFAQSRSAFFKGDFSSYGWASFFPYTFLVKTPLATLALATLAVAAWLAIRRRDRTTTGPAWPATLPLWTLLGVYWAVVLTSNLNIGHRHILATYPPLFILCGGAAAWLGRSRALAAVAGGLVVLQAGEIAFRFPHYLAYFNGLITPAEAHRHFTDSTLDWGQDLPGVQSYLAENPSQGPFYLSYFGNGYPRTYGIKARLLASNPGRFNEEQPPLLLHRLPREVGPEMVDALVRELPDYDLIGASTQPQGTLTVFVKKPAAFQLAAGTYLISATMLQSRWAQDDEQVYQRFRAAVMPLFTETDRAARARILGQLEPAQWISAIETFEKLRLIRLTSFLHRYEPDDHIGYSILVYRLTDADVAAALEGPAPVDHRFLGRKLHPAAR